jgi:2-dehydro-3-deoxy-D-arabinonate dehydratase
MGPGILLAKPDELGDLPIRLEVLGQGVVAFQGETRTAKMKRRLQGLVDYLGRELDFPHGVFLMTGTGIVPGNEFTLASGDVVRIKIGSLVLENQVRN